MKKKQNEHGNVLKIHCNRIFMIMKITLFLIFCFVFQLHATVNGQVQFVSLRLENVSLNEAILELKKQTNLDFFFSNKEVDVKSRISLNVDNMKLEEVMRKMLGDSFVCEFVDNMVVIKPVGRHTPLLPQKRMQIAGRVKEKQGETLPGVAVIIKGTSVGCTTDEDGKFSFAIPETKDVVLVFSFIGMKTQEIVYKGQTEINVVMEPSVTEIGEVVITGMFEKPRESYTGAVTTITEKDLKMFGSRNVLTTLRNIDPSFNILENNEFGSDPNRLPEIQLRGTSSLPSVQDLQTSARANLNQPLFILDGFEISLRTMMDMDDNEIESINILKDASATAIYGSKGANGVVVITRKKPKEGKLRFTYRGDLNVEVPDLSAYDVLNAAEKLELERKAGRYNTTNIASDLELKEVYNEKLGWVVKGIDTYWLSQPLRTGVGQRHNVRVEGGNETFRYGAALNYNQIIGVMKGSDRKNFSGTVDLTYTQKKVIFRNSLTVDLSNSNESPYGQFSQYVTLNPYWTPYEDNNKVKTILEHIVTVPYQSNVPNPLYNATLNVVDMSKGQGIRNNFSIEWRINPGFTFRSQLGLSKNISTRDNFKPARHTDFNGYKGEDFFRKGRYSYTTSESFNYDANFTLSYTKTFVEKHQVYMGLNYKLYQQQQQSYNFAVEGFVNDNLDFLGMALQYMKDGKPGGSESTSRTLGFTGNLNYTYASRYFADFSYRVDGSSQFGENKQFAPFWSVGTGWNVHNEKFMEGIQPILNQMRIRFSYGVNGSQNFGAYQALMTYKYYSDDRYKDWIGAYLMALGNENLKWQQTGQYNVGVEFAFLNNRINLQGDYYIKRTTNLLSEMELPLSNGFQAYTENVGEVENRGVELRASAFLIRNTERKITWSVTANLATNRNKIVQISEALKKANQALEAQGGTSPSYMYREGESMETIYVVRSLGIDPATGREVFMKKDGVTTTYNWNANDKIACGLSEPKYRGNLSTMFRYADLTLNASFGFRMGGQKYNQTLVDRVENADVNSNVDRRVNEQRWQKPGDVTFFKDVADKSKTQMSSRFVQDENTFECQNIYLTYDLKNEWLKNHLSLQVLSFSANMGDLFRFSTIKMERGIYYPFSRKVSFSLSATF